MDRTMNVVIGIAALAGIILLIVFSLGSNTELNGDSVSEDKETIKIGVVIPLSGGAGFLGEGVRDAMLLAQSELPETKYNYELIFEDDRLEPKLSSTATNKLIEVDRVNAIVSATSGTGNVVSPVTQKNGVVHMGIASDHNVASGKYNFIHWTPPKEEARVFVEELLRREIKKVALLGVNQGGVVENFDDLDREIEGTGIEIVYRDLFSFGDKDFKTMILKAQKENPEIYLLLAWSPEIEILAKQIRELGIEEPLTSIEAFEYSETPELFEGSWYVSAADATDSYNNAFKERYDRDPTIASPGGYDAFNILVHSYEAAGKSSTGIPDNDQVIKVLSELKGFEGALGNLNMLDSGVIHSEAVVRKVENGKFVTIRS